MGTVSSMEEVVELEMDDELVPKDVEEQPATDVDAELQDAQEKQAIEDLPEKFRGKSPKEVVEMYENLEKEFGRKGQELGELRQLTDTLIQKELSTPQPSTVTKEVTEDVDFYEDPEKAVERLLEKKLAPFNQHLEKMSHEEFSNRMKLEFPDHPKILQSEDFGKWVQASPYRIKMYQEADQFNWDAANELFSTWIALHPTPEENKETRDKQLADAKTEKGKGAGKTKTKKVYRRADIIRLKMYEPEKYAALESDIRKAYAEGRVK